jgi:hypothetical protein
VNVLDLSQVRESAALTRARRELPYPIARAARLVQQTTDPKDTYEAVMMAAETTTTILGITAIAWAREYGVVTPALEQVQQAFVTRGASWGHWADAFASLDLPVHQRADDALPGMGDALKKPAKGKPGMASDLKEFNEERNRRAHNSGPRNKVEAAERAAAYFPVLERVLERSSFLAQAPWILVRDTKLRRRENDFLVHASRAMGDHPDFEFVELTTPQALAEEVFYLQTPTRFIDLTPLVVMRQCPTCHQQEVAFADKVDPKKGVVLKTFDRGHLLFDPLLADEARTLVGAIGPEAGQAG